MVTARTQRLAGPQIPRQLTFQSPDAPCSVQPFFTAIRTPFPAGCACWMPNALDGSTLFISRISGAPAAGDSNFPLPGRMQSPTRARSREEISVFDHQNG